MVLSGLVRLVMNIEVKPSKAHTDSDGHQEKAFTMREIDVEILGKFGIFGISHQLLRSSKAVGHLYQQQGTTTPKSPTVRNRMAMYKKNVKLHYNCTAKTAQTSEILFIPKFVFTALTASNDAKVKFCLNALFKCLV
jgi:hypothetical protein